MSDCLTSIRKSAISRVALQEAVNPHQARQISLTLFGKYEPISRDKVVAILGEEAAAKLDAIRAAIAEFHEATHD
ncbi:hypothetical protein JWJ88_17150 [Paracoccus methylovorus]|uniref:Uncharacterized protein n=1 Tax=Paracoccus methylovorus TaxID=2812658 RepID=A0ABX7JL93_9RHOB|nr:hypothetical protein [Paracoccus methylovorus]QRZ14691.1 hypothetical protein JWJ88_17150 [Paracoccus methylovorus]